jgi:hypothetical protein
MNTDPQTRTICEMECRAQEAAKRRGMLAIKSDKLIGSESNCGGFQLVDLKTRKVEAGEKFDLSAADVIGMLENQ